MRILFSMTFSMLLVVVSFQAQSQILKIATFAPDGTLWVQELRKSVEEIDKRTEGRVTIKLYTGGSMGSDREVLRKIRAGQLQGGALTGGALSLIFPDSQVYSLPMMFHSYAELDYVRARMDKKIIQGIEDHGFVTFELTDGGFAYIMSNLRVNHVADLKILKNWVPEGDEITRAMFSSLDAPTLSLPLTDVLTGLQTGLITSIGCTPTGAIALQWHTKTKYLTDLPIMSLYGAMVVDKKPFSNLSQPDQIVVREVISKVISVMSRQTRIDDNGARDALRKQGIVFTALPDEEITKLDSAADKTIQYAIKQGVVSEAIFNELKTNLIAYRRSHPESH